MSRPRPLLVLLFATTLVMAGAPAGSAQELEPGGSFEDDNGNVHEGFIEAVAAAGMTVGCNPPDNDRYCPDQPVTRGQMTAFLDRALDLDTAATGDTFTDDDTSEFEANIEALAAAGITVGCNPPDNDRYCPDQPVTRGQMTAFLDRALDLDTAATGDTFTDDDTSEFEANIEALAAAGITVGCNPPDNDRYCPDELVLRDQMASFLGRALDLTEMTPPPIPGGTLITCASTEGFVISYPQEWATNDGTVVPECSMFDPEPFEVPEGTDARVAAITAYIDEVPFAEVASSVQGPGVERAITAIDGLQAVRLAYLADADGLWPEGTPITTYAVDLDPVSPGSTLLIDTVGVGAFEYEQNQVILDRMARTVDVTGIEPAPEGSTVVARFGGGGGAFEVHARADDGDICLTIPPSGEPECIAAPDEDEVAIVALDNLGPIIAGTAAERVFSVTAQRADSDSVTALTVEIAPTGLAGFAFPFEPDEVNGYVLRDLFGTEIATVPAG